MCFVVLTALSSGMLCHTEAVGSSEMLVNFYNTALHHIPAESILQIIFIF
jgi:hypothetical protein